MKFFWNILGLLLLVLAASMTPPDKGWAASPCDSQRIYGYNCIAETLDPPGYYCPEVETYNCSGGVGDEVGVNCVYTSPNACPR